MTTMENELDWGTLAREKFVDYIERIENQIDFALAHNLSIPTSIILQIFNDVTSNPNDRKMGDLYFILKKKIGREPVMDDLLALQEYVKRRIESKAVRRPLLELWQ